MNGERPNQTYYDDSGWGKAPEDMDGSDYAALNGGAQPREEAYGMHETGDTYEAIQELVNEGLADALEVAAQTLRQKMEARRGQKANEAALRGTERLETQPATTQADANEQEKGTSIETSTETGSVDATPGE